MIASDDWPLNDPELGPRFFAHIKASLKPSRMLVEQLMNAYLRELKRDVLPTLGLLVLSILSAIRAIVGYTTEFLGLAVGSLVGGMISLALAFNDAQDGFKDWLITASVMRVASRSWEPNQIDSRLPKKETQP